MLSALDLRNFQCHESLHLELDRRCTTLVGRTDSGKSAIIRALRWVCFNQPSGTSFVRQESRFARVVLTVDGKKVTRNRGKRNTYDLDGKRFVAFGSDVPPEIADLLNLGAINFQLQHDRPFQLSETPGEVARQLNRIVNLGSIDSALRNVAGELRTAGVEITLTRDRLTAARTRRRELRWVPEYLDKLDKLDKAETWLATKRSRINALQSILRGVESIEVRADTVSKAILAGRAAVGAGERVGGEQLRIQALRELIQEIRFADDRYVENYQELIHASRKLAEVKQCPVCRRPIPS